LVRAAQILQNLPPEDETVVPPRGKRPIEIDLQMALFTPEEILRAELRSLNLDHMTPLEALTTLSRLQKDAKS